MTVNHLPASGITPLKSKDQFFLQDEELLDFEVRLAKLEKNDTVLEIGAGTGNLTKKIAEKCSVLTIESDARFVPLLEKIKNATVICEDAPRVLEAARKEGLGFTKVVSNIPYGKSQDILLELLRHKWELAVLCVQREFAQKLQEKSKLGIAVRDCCNLTYAADVPAGAFYPTAVDSSIILLKQRRLLDMEFWNFLGVVYRKKNRDVKNVVTNAPGDLAKKKVHQLTTEELKALFEAYKQL